MKLAERWAAEHGVDLAQSYFYSDSFNDRPMLERVGTAIAINPDARLSRLAKQRGWPMMTRLIPSTSIWWLRSPVTAIRFECASGEVATVNGRRSARRTGSTTD